jgi:hypothetical protein
MSNQVQPYEQQSRTVSIFNSQSAFEYSQRMAKFLSQSDLVPAQFRGDNKGIANCMIALEFSNRMGVSPLMVMQNIHIIEGRPTFSAKFMAAMLADNGYSIDYQMETQGKQKIEVEYWVGPKGQKERKVAVKEIENRTCRVRATYNGRPLDGPWVSIEMAHKEGWFDKAGSKWKTMPEVMLRYRAISFFANMYAPNLIMGMRTKEEAEDILPVFPDVDADFEELENDPQPEPDVIQENNVVPDSSPEDAELI